MIYFPEGEAKSLMCKRGNSVPIRQEGCFMEASAKLKKIIRILPDDVIIGILAKLPVKSLLRFRCVSILWRSLIFEPYFIERHRLEHAEKNPDLFFMTNNDRMLHHYSLEEGRDDTHELPKDITEFWDIFSNGCHGLFLLSEKERNHVYNPATRELITLPEASQHIPFYKAPNQNVGLGYNDVAKEYKIVRFFNSQCSYKTEFHMECEIFTLGVSDSWRRVGSIPYPLIIFMPVFVNDSLYWMVESRLLMNRSALIISVNLRDEKISIIPHPSFCSDPNKNCIDMWLGRLGGCLSLLDKTTVPLLDIWMLKDCTKPIWIKAYSINMLTIGFYGNTLCNVIPYVIPVAILSNGNILISIDSQLSEYDPRTKTIMNYEGGYKYPYEGGWKYRFLVHHTYTESLVPLRIR